MTLSADEVTLCNQALDVIGAGIFTYANQATNNEGLKCNRHYDQTRDSLLREFEWPFASTRAELTEYGTGTVLAWEGNILEWEDEELYYGVIHYDDDFEWGYIFDLPSDCLRVKSIYELYGQEYEETDRFEIEGDLLYINLDEVHIRYIKSVTDPDDFDPLFTEILILRLALKLLNPLAGTENETLRQDIEIKLRRLESRARAVCREETNVTGYSTWNNSRYGSGKV